MTIENENTENTADTSVDTSVDTSTDTPAEVVVDESAPKTMLEAIEAAVPDPNKPAEDVKPEVAEEVDPNAEVKPESEEDATKMPEGLTPKAQERFQKLANDNKVVRQELDDVLSSVEPFRQSLQENKVTPEQFGMATEYIGLINKGDLDGAYAVMEKELRQLSLLMGKSIGGVDALSGFEDLRNAVDTFQITEAHALELARQRSNEQSQQAAQQQLQQRQQQVEQQRQQESQRNEEFQKGVGAVDAFTKSKMKTDLDYARVEAILLPQIPKLIKNAHPDDFVDIVQSAYDMIKASAGASKQAPSGGNTLRATGTGSPSQAPKSMMDAMFPNG